MEVKINVDRSRAHWARAYDAEGKEIDPKDVETVYQKLRKFKLERPESKIGLSFTNLGRTRDSAMNKQHKTVGW